MANTNDTSILRSILPPSTTIISLTCLPKHIASKDVCLLGWILASLSEKLVSTIYGLETSKQVWTALQTRFSSQSRSRISHLKRQLQTLTQGTKSCSEYLESAKTLADQLAAGKPVDDQDLISFLLGGLQSSYTPFVTSFNFASRETDFTFEDFQAELLGYENLLDVNHSVHNTDGPHFAFAANKSKAPTYLCHLQLILLPLQFKCQFLRHPPLPNNLQLLHPMTILLLLPLQLLRIPLNQILSFHQYLILHKCFLDTPEPTSYTQAVSDPQWRAAMGREFDALMENGTWSLCPRPLDKHIVRNKWVYKIKRRPDGSIERFKARLVAKGYDQKSGVDYHETFSPVIKPTTIRLVLAIAVHFHWPIQQLDVSNAFLHGFLDEEVFMEQPRGFVDETKPHYVCKLHKSLYGLKQAPRAWFRRLSQQLIELGFHESVNDYSLFTLHTDHARIFVLIYVDDILVTGSDTFAITKLIRHLQSIFHVKDLGSLSYFLGVEVDRSSQGLHLRQTKYICDLLDRTHMAGAKPLASPTVASTKLSSTNGELLSDPSTYRHIIGALQYCTITRPDISYVNHCQYMHQPRTPHWQAMKRVLRYLKGSVNHGLFYTPSPLQLHTYCDSDWAGNPDDRRSTSGYGVFLGRNLVSWSSKKQHVVSRSSTEAEYRSMALATAEVYWLRMLFKELAIGLIHIPTIWCDNIGAIALASNPVFHARTKHVEIDYHFIREKVCNHDIQVQHISTVDQIADVFTKGQTAKRFQYLKGKLMVCQNPINSRGGVRLSRIFRNSEASRTDPHSIHSFLIQNDLAVSIIFSYKCVFDCFLISAHTCVPYYTLVSSIVQL
ncbi:hypothetical protein AAG906_012309 [Vitis piasezkii]